MKQTHDRGPPFNEDLPHSWPGLQRDKKACSMQTLQSLSVMPPLPHAPSHPDHPVWVTSVSTDARRVSSLRSCLPQWLFTWPAVGAMAPERSYVITETSKRCLDYARYQ